MILFALQVIELHLVYYFKLYYLGSSVRSVKNSALELDYQDSYCKSPLQKSRDIGASLIGCLNGHVIIGSISIGLNAVLFEFDPINSNMIGVDRLMSDKAAGLKKAARAGQVWGPIQLTWPHLYRQPLSARS